jgi:hypothetical protein
VCALGILAFCYRSEKIYILFLLTLLVFIVILIYAFTLKVETDGIDLEKKTIFGKKRVKLQDMVDLSVMNLRGRCAFFFIARDSFIIISSALANFEELRSKLLPSLPENCCTPLESISREALEKKAKRFKLALVVLLVLAVGASFWRSFNAGS